MKIIYKTCDSCGSAFELEAAGTWVGDRYLCNDCQELIIDDEVIQKRLETYGRGVD